jgi:hypothetical protein
VGSDEENTAARRFKDLDIPSSKFEVHAWYIEVHIHQDTGLAIDAEVLTMGDECQPSGPTVTAADPSLAEKVSAIIKHSSSERNHKYFNPPPEARYLLNRNIARVTEGPMSPVAQYEGQIGPSDINLDSTCCSSNFDPPFTFVRLYTEIAFLCN